MALGVGVAVGAGVVIGATEGTGVAVATGVVVPIGVALGATEGLAEGVAAGLALGEAVGTGAGVTDAAQVAIVIVFVSRVTAPFRASARPSIEALVTSVMEVRARMLPLKLVLPPKVAELPTCQKTLHD